MDLERIKLDHFVHEKRREHNRHKKSDTASNFSPNGMFIKFGICAAACALVLLINWMEAPPSVSVGGGPNAEQQSESEDMLGKLKFVQLPGILEVFASEDKLKVPLAFTSWELAQGDTQLFLTSESDQYVVSGADGTVKSSEEGLIALRLENDKEIVYTGNMIVHVESGQTVKAGDSLGSIGADEVLGVKVNVSGLPQNPLEEFNISLK